MCKMPDFVYIDANSKLRVRCSQKQVSLWDRLCAPVATLPTADRLQKSSIVRTGIPHQLALSLSARQVLSEILQQAARLDCPDAGAETTRRLKGVLPPLTDAELRRWRAQIALGGLGALAAVPRLHVSTHRIGEISRVGFQKQRGDTMSPAAREAAKRQFMVGLRMIMYGSALGVLGVVGVGTYLCHTFQITSLEDLRQTLRSKAAPCGELIHEEMAPFRDWARAFVSTWQMKPEGENSDSQVVHYDTEFSRALKQRFRNRT
eukprot:evm.model.scf_519EXC.1 EVM.evm.TU.scf_519EXC.1   scf_519EXC:1561-3541(+)